MRVQRVIGVILLLVGTGLMISGLMDTQNIAEKIAADITGDYSRATTWQMVAGTIVLICGGIITVRSFRKGKS